MNRSLIAAAVITAILSGTLWTAAAHAADTGPIVKKSLFGRLPDGTAVDRYTLTNSHGLQADVMTLGATLITVKTPDRQGKLAPITLYLDTLDDYLRGHPLFGSVVGRYANRIAGAKFTLDSVEYPLTPNAGVHHIHGGADDPMAQSVELDGAQQQQAAGDDRGRASGGGQGSMSPKFPSLRL